MSLKQCIIKLANRSQLSKKKGNSDKRGETVDENREKNGLVIINKEKEVCKGLWTRAKSQERSILGYALA